MPSKAFKAMRQGLLEAVQFAEGQTKGARARRFPAPDVDVGKLRQELGLSQIEFAKGFRVPIGTVQNWEQGRRRPRGPARVLLTIIQSDPQHAFEAIWPEKSGPRPASKDPGTGVSRAQAKVR
jgi:putative transcriptional regulator